MSGPLDIELLEKIFRKNPRNPNLIGTNEGYGIEYKESFGWASLSEYLRTMAAFANRQGGYIIFGIKNSPHELIGLQDAALGRFQEIDIALWSTSVREHFSPAFNWDKRTYICNGKNVGIIYTFEAESKPVICKNDADELRKGAIYFRYKGQSTEIEYPELFSIIQKEKDKINEQWMQKIKQISAAGVANSAVLNLNTGKVNGTSDTLYIDESLLNEIKFINEGKFVETDGEPTLKIIGTVQPVAGVPAIVVETERDLAINYDLIIKSFLNEEEIRTPTEYIKQICYHTAATLPVYYYMYKAGMSKTDTLDYLDGLPNDTDVRRKLKKRIETDSVKYFPITSIRTDTSKERARIRDSLLNENVTLSENPNDLRYLLLAIRSLSKEEIIAHRQFLFNIIKTIYENEYDAADNLIKGEIRYAICWLDEALYMSGN